MSLSLLVTGGSGFIGSALIRHLLANTSHHVTNLDKLTYAANPASLASVAGHPRYRCVRADVADQSALKAVLNQVRPDVVVHLAAESHVDRSISGPAAFVQTNVVGTFCVLEEVRAYLDTLPGSAADQFRLVHASTDEVFGELSDETSLFNEASPYAPNSPYSASKAGADHLVMAWSRTYGLPVIMTHSANNYGPCQHPEKLIPKALLRGLAGSSIPLYGNGQQRRDWLFVEDHVEALMCVVDKGSIGERYLIGGGEECSNQHVVEMVCDELMRNAAPSSLAHYRDLITFVEDRPGHDIRYALDASLIRTLGWQPSVTFSEGLARTVRWYLEHRDWWAWSLNRPGGQ